MTIPSAATSENPVLTSFDRRKYKRPVQLKQAYRTILRNFENARGQILGRILRFSGRIIRLRPLIESPGHTS